MFVVLRVDVYNVFIKCKDKDATSWNAVSAVEPSTLFEPLHLLYALEKLVKGALFHKFPESRCCVVSRIWSNVFLIDGVVKVLSELGQINKHTTPLPTTAQRAERPSTPLARCTYELY